MSPPRLYLFDPMGSIREHCISLGELDHRGHVEFEPYLQSLSTTTGPVVTAVDARALVETHRSALRSFLRNRTALALVVVDRVDEGTRWLEAGAAEVALDACEPGLLDARLRSLLSLSARLMSPGWQTELQGTFLRELAHDLKTPLNAVLGYAELILMEEDLPDRVRLDVGRILQNGNRLLVGIERLGGRATSLRQDASEPAERRELETA